MLSERKKKEIRALAYKNMGCTSTEVMSWGAKDYRIDNSVARQFEDLLSHADKVHIFGDYDCDGVCATVIITDVIKAVTGKDPVPHLPRRFTDGYGLKVSQIDKIYEEDKEALAAGKKIAIVTVDNGIRAGEAVEKAKDYGYTVIVTDHHELGDDEVPKADLVIDPKVKECNPFLFDGYCGAGVAWKLAEKFLTVRDHVKELEVYAALATVADVMVLHEENYLLVKDALNRMHEGYVPFPLKLLGDAHQKAKDRGKEFPFSHIESSDFGYTFAPIINAAGRLQDSGAKRVYDFFEHPDVIEATDLVENNLRRKAMADEQDRQADGLVDKDIDRTVITPQILYGDFQPGIVGIVAGHMAEKYGIPFIVVTDTGNGVVKGSARSIPGFSIFSYLSDMKERHPEWILGFGGHEGAAGVSFDKNHMGDILSYHPIYPLPEAAAGLEEKQISIRKEDIPDAWNVIKDLRPFGEGNPGVTFRIYFHRFFDNARTSPKDYMYINTDDYKIGCQKYSEKVPHDKDGKEVQKLIGVGHLEEDFYNGIVTPAFSIDTLEAYQPKEKEKTCPEKQAEADSMDEIDYSED